MPNSWRPILYARIHASDGGGSKLVGSIGTPFETRIFVLLLFPAMIAGSAIPLALSPRGEATLWLGITLASLAFAAALHYSCYRAGLRDERALIDWLTLRVTAVT